MAERGLASEMIVDRTRIGGGSRPKRRRILGAYSRVWRQGALADVDRRTAEGRFLADGVAELVAFVGGDPDPLMRRTILDQVADEWRFKLLADQEAAGTLSDHGRKVQGGIASRIRLRAREIRAYAREHGGAPRKGPSLADHLAALARQGEAAE